MQIIFQDESRDGASENTGNTNISLFMFFLLIFYLDFSSFIKINKENRGIWSSFLRNCTLNCIHNEFHLRDNASISELFICRCYYFFKYFETVPLIDADLKQTARTGRYRLCADHQAAGIGTTPAGRHGNCVSRLPLLTTKGQELELLQQAATENA